MPLAASLDASFGEGGFDLDASFSGLADTFGAVSLPSVSFTADAPDLGSLTVDGVTESLASVVGRLGDVTGALPDLDSLLAPLQGALTLLDVVGSGDLPTLIGDLETSVGPEGPGLPALFSAAGRIGDVPAVRSMLDIVGPFGLDLSSPGALVGGPAGGLVSLVQLVGALLGVETASGRIEERATLAADLLAAPRIEALIAAIGSGTGARLAGLLDGVDPNDPRLAELVAGPIELYLADVRELLDLLVRGLAFSEATLVDADFPTLAAGLTLASVALSSSALQPVDELVASIRDLATPLLAVEVPSLGGADAVWGASATLAAQLETLVSGIDPSALRQVVDPIIDPVLTPVRAAREALDEVAAVLGTVLDPIREALAAIDLSAVTDAINAVVDPVRDAVAAVADLIEGATIEMQGVVDAVDVALEPVRTALNTAKDAIAAPFEAVSAVLDTLDLEDLADRARSTLTSVSDALASVPIQPVFDVASDAVNTAADALGLVPKALLPDDLKAALEAACGPVEALDLEPIREELHIRLEAIIDSLDTSVLETLEAGYAEVKAFVASIDPHPHLVALEQEAFGVLVGAIDQLDPTVVLEPVTTALDQVAAVLDGIDLDGMLAPADAALDTVVEALDSVDPSTLLAPIEELLDGVRSQVDDALGLSTWLEHLDAVERSVRDAADRVDPTPTFDALRSGWVDLIDMLRPTPGGSGFASAIASTVLGGLPFAANSGGIGEVIAWVRAERDGATVVRDRLTAATAVLDTARAAVASIDVRSLTAELDAGHRALAAAVGGLPDDSVLRVRLDPSIAISSPTPSLALLLTNVDRVQAAIGSAATAAAATTAPDRSEVSLVASGLAVSFGPLAPVGDKLRSLLTAVGANPDTPDPRDALADLLIAAGPEAVLGPFEAVITSLLDRAVDLVGDGLLGPLREGVTEIGDLVEQLSVDGLSGGLGELHQELVDMVDALRPRNALADPLALFDEMTTMLDDFDPFAPVQAVIDALRTLVTGFVADFSPTAVLAPVVTVYDQLAALIGGFDIADLLEPIITRLTAIGGDVDHGMDDVIDALVRLKEACESDGGPIPGLDLSIAASVDVGGGFGL